MAVSANTVVECRATNGSDSNGGGFVAGASGTDYSQQNSAQGSGTNLTVDGTTNTKVNPDGYTVAATDVGNIIQITTTGTGAAFTVSFYQITGATTGTSSTQRWTLDRSPAAVSSAGATWAMGGALKTVGKVSTMMNLTAGMAGFLKSEATYGITAGVTFSASQGLSNSAPYSTLRGYTTTRGDLGPATIQITSGTGITALTFSGNGWDVAGLVIDCNSTTTSIGMTFNAQFQRARNCVVKNFKSFGIDVTGGQFVLIDQCEVTGGLSGATAAINNNTQANVTGCWVHGNVCSGITFSNGDQESSAVGNLITNNSGASSDGLVPGQFGLFLGNIIYKCGRHGINLSTNSTFNKGFLVIGNLITDSGGWGIVGSSSGAGTVASPFFDGNCFYNNTSGNREFMDDTGGTNAINGVTGVKYTNVRDVAITAGSPFTNPSGGDFSINNTANRGALVRGHGVPAAIFNYTGTAYPDFGCLQHQDSASGGSLNKGILSGAVL